MIENSNSIDMVAQVLGHNSIVSARQYISLDLIGLKKCALSFDVLSDKL